MDWNYLAGLILRWGEDGYAAGSERADCSLGTIGPFRAKELVERQQRGFLPASDRHLLTQHQQILLAPLENAQ
jgi:hypothetical protein